MLSIILARKIGKNILAVNQKLMDVIYSNGDLTKKLEVTSGDELEIVADNINALLENVRTNMIKLKTSSIDMKESFDNFREDMDSSVEQITQVSATMQEMYGSMEETSDSFNKAKEMAQVVTHSIDDVKEKTTYGFDFSEKIEYKSSELKEGEDLAGKFLIAATLKDADLTGANLIGCDLRDADIRGVNLSECIFLTQSQINTAKGNDTTKLPRALARPSYWEK